MKFRHEHNLIIFQKELTHRLKTRKARETGICAIREELYAQCFDELIRQITIELSYRGLLLVRVRDEMRMTIQSYQTLYESALAYGMRKALQGEHKKSEMQDTISNLQKTCSKVEGEVEELEKEIQNIIENDKIQMKKDKEAHEEEVKTLKDRNKWMREQLEKELSGEAKREKEKEEKKKSKKKKKR